jgi:hypothetical protein
VQKAVMPQTIGIPWGDKATDLSFNYKGPFSLEGLYKLLYDYLTFKKFCSANMGVKNEKWSSAGDVNFEDYYFEYVLPGGTNKNHWIWWRTRKEESDFFWYEIDIDFQTLVLGTKEEVYKGAKIKLNEGEITFFIRARLVFDPLDHWTKQSFGPDLFAWIERNHYYKQIDEKVGDLKGEVEGIFDKARQFMGMYTLDSSAEPFVPSGGYPQI